MAVTAYGYGPNVWTTAKPTGPVDMPQLAPAGTVAPKFKERNPLAGYAAKMVGELAYGAMAEKMAPQWIGYDEDLGKDVYRIQPGSEQFAPEGGWVAGDNGVFEYQLPRLTKEFEIKRMEDFESQFEADLLNPPKGLEDRGPIDASGNYFTPSIAQPEETTVEVADGLAPVTDFNWGGVDLKDPKLDVSLLPDEPGKRTGGTWTWVKDDAGTMVGDALGLKHAFKGTWIYVQPTEKESRFSS